MIENTIGTAELDDGAEEWVAMERRYPEEMARQNEEYAEIQELQRRLHAEVEGRIQPMYREYWDRNTRKNEELLAGVWSSSEESQLG